MSTKTEEIKEEIKEQPKKEKAPKEEKKDTKKKKKTYTVDELLSQNERMELFDEYGRRKKIKVKVKEGKLKKRENRMGYVFMIPYVAGALICLLYPLIIAIIYAFSNVVVKTNTVTFNGIQNFASVLDKNPELITQLGTLAFKMLLGVPLIVVFALLMAMMLVFVNRIISVRISRPIMKLDHSVREYQEGKEEKIAIGGSTEIRHLGQSIQESYRQNSELMKKVIWEQNERRKSEFDVLQSQINPHFLYNTLDSITWMIESGKNEEAAFMITQLAKLFRISLSKGHTVIRIRDELQHAQSYVNIQKVRYKNKFEVVFDIRPDILDDCIVKLVLQPILENAINYGVREMDDCGKILIRGWKEQENIFMQVSDNGMGIPEEEIDLLLKDTNRVHKKGSGVGLVNVNNRLRLLFGEPYGLQIESELDEGTTVTVIIPEIVYSEENCRKFEEHHMPEDS